MSNEKINISLSTSSITEPTGLTIEVQEYSDYVGRMSKADLALSVNAFLNPDQPELRVPARCGGQNGTFQTVIFVYRQDPALPYRLESSEGELGSRNIDIIENRETIKCSLRSFVEFEFPSIGLIGVPEWAGPVYNRDGVEITPPSFIPTPTGISFPLPVYGSVRVVYRVNRHRYLYTMNRVENARENAYFSVVYAITSNGVVSEEVEPPYDFENSNGNCGLTPVVNIEPVPGPGIPTVTKEDRTQRVNYCSQELIDG